MLDILKGRSMRLRDRNEEEEEKSGKLQKLWRENTPKKLEVCINEKRFRISSEP